MLLRFNRLARGFALGAALCGLAGCIEDPKSRLFDAAYNCDLSEANAALAAKADVNAGDEDGDTPLMKASGNGCVAVAKVLIAAGADVNVKSRGLTNGETALMLASTIYGDPEIVRSLLAAGADVNARTSDGDTALAHAARYGQLEAAQALIAAGADVNPREASRETPLDEAMFKDLVGKGNFGTTKGHDDVAELIRRHGGVVYSPWNPLAPNAPESTNRH